MHNQVIDSLRRLPLITYLESVNRDGRQAIDSDTRAQAVALFDFADRLLSFETALGPATRSVLQLVQDVMFAEKFLSTQEKPRYVAYSNLRVLDRFLLTGQAAPLEDKIIATKSALAIVVREWHHLEQERLSAHAAGTLDHGLLGFELRGGSKDPVAHLRERERALQELSNFSAVANIYDTRIILTEVHHFDSDWSYFANRPERQVAHLTCLPRSRWHDEHMFLRTIHATECCFAGILACLAALPPSIRRQDFESAVIILKNTLFFSDFLIKLWAVFNTMPVAHFYDGFRGATGDGSAIQSIRFQMVEVLTRGLGEAKRAALLHQKEAGFAAVWTPPAEATLRGMCEIAKEVPQAGAEFVNVAEMLDHDLYQWRTKHYGVARRYLPPDSIGTGNEGVPYLANNYKEPRPLGDATGAGSSLDTAANEAGPARASSTFGVRRHGAPPIAVFEVGNVSTRVADEAVRSGIDQLKDLLKTRSQLIAHNLDGYKKFFGTHQYPVARQLEMFKRNATLPSNLVPALLLFLELRSATLMGLHDKTRVAGSMVFDTASADESYESISGKIIKCRADEPIVRDEKGIIASVFQGPDKRTAVREEGKSNHPSWLLVIMGHPGMLTNDFMVAVQDVSDFLGSIAPGTAKKWIIHEPK